MAVAAANDDVHSVIKKHRATPCDSAHLVVGTGADIITLVPHTPSVIFHKDNFGALMKLTNRFHLPEPIVEAVRNDPYNKGDCDYSITGLLRPPRIAQLEREHDSELEEDVSDRIWSLCGQVVHGILERAERTAMAEKRLYAEIAGKRISGQLDRFVIIDKKLQDYKFITTWKIKSGVPKEYEEQQNCYAWLLRQNSYEVAKSELVCILRDWNRSASLRQEDYPPHHVSILPVKLWPNEEVETFIRRRIQLHESATHRLPRCDGEERWSTPDIFAVMVPNRKRAIRLYENEQEALQHVVAFPDANYYIDRRLGEFGKRCSMGYCPVSRFCLQFQEHNG